MGRDFRCPVDDCVFTTQKIDRVPTLEGHPECPGPVCREKFAGYPGADEVKPIVPVVHAVHAPKASARENAGGTVSPLAPPPVGQGW
jgi:hypothetical protein